MAWVWVVAVAGVLVVVGAVTAAAALIAVGAEVDDERLLDEG